MDAEEGGSVGQDSRERRIAENGRLLHHQFPIRMDVLGHGLARRKVAGVDETRAPSPQCSRDAHARAIGQSSEWAVLAACAQSETYRISLGKRRWEGGQALAACRPSGVGRENTEATLGTARSVRTVTQRCFDYESKTFQPWFTSGIEHKGEMDGVTTLGLTAGTLTTIAFIPQIVKARQSKSTGDLSWGMVTIFSTGVLLWLIYGIWIDSLPVILANAVTLLLQCGIIALKIRYG